MVDFEREKPLPFKLATKKLPGKPGLATLHRWRLNGIDGVKLETFLLGGRRCTTMEAFTRFCEAVTAARDKKPPQTRTTREKMKQRGQADRILAKAGI